MALLTWKLVVFVLCLMLVDLGRCCCDSIDDLALETLSVIRQVKAEIKWEIQAKKEGHKKAIKNRQFYSTYFLTSRARTIILSYPHHHPLHAQAAPELHDHNASTRHCNSKGQERLGTTSSSTPPPTNTAMAGQREEKCVDCRPDPCHPSTSIAAPTSPPTVAKKEQGPKKEDVLDPTTFVPPIDLSAASAGMAKPLVVIEVSNYTIGLGFAMSDDCCSFPFLVIQCACLGRVVLPTMQIRPPSKLDSTGTTLNFRPHHHHR